MAGGMADGGTADSLKKQKRRNGEPGVIRTRDPLLRRQMLYPTELRAQRFYSNSAAASLIVSENAFSAFRFWDAAGATYKDPFA
jgi:hypothetical protein